MTRTTADSSVTLNMLATAERLRKDCQQFQLSLALLERDLSGGEDDNCLRRLEKAGQLRERISQGVKALQPLESDASELSAAVQKALRNQVKQSQRLLVESSETCAMLAERVCELHADIGQKLRDMRTGSKMLGSYKAHAHVLAE